MQCDLENSTDVYATMKSGICLMNWGQETGKKKLVPDRKYCMTDVGGEKHKKATEHPIWQIDSGYYVPDIITHVILKTTFQSKYHHHSCLIG